MHNPLFIQSILTTQGLTTSDIVQQVNVKALIEELQALPPDLINDKGNIELKINVRDFPSREGGLTHFRPLVKPPKQVPESHKASIEIK